MFENRSFARVLVPAAVLLAPAAASAHFTLVDPAAATTQSALGDPQKAPPCGDDGTATPSGDVTAFQTGSTITITIRETIFHPGHYRVALAPDPSMLPEEPPVTAGTTPCGSTTIMDPPVFPVLADGVLVHTAPFSGPQSFDVQLPAGMTCDHCTLQVIQFMSNHVLNNPGGCFYHHCATVNIQDVVVDAGMSVDSGMMSVDANVAADSASPEDAAGRDAGPAAPTAQACACSAPGATPTHNHLAWAALALPAVMFARRRRRS